MSTYNFVVTDACNKCEGESDWPLCQEYCPVECFYDAGSQVVINPDECIYCSLCVYECPVNWYGEEPAIAEDGYDLPPEKQSFVEFNETKSQTSPLVEWG